MERIIRGGKNINRKKECRNKSRLGMHSALIDMKLEKKLKN